MKRIIKILALLFIIIGSFYLSASHSKTYAVSPDGTYTYWILPSSGYTNMQFSITPYTDPSPQGWFWSHQFWINNSGSPMNGGYTGIQTEGSGFNGKIAIFSIWNANGASNSAIPQSQCLQFSGEGTGYSCRIPYNWSVGRTYKFNLTQIDPSTWEATITDMTSNVSSLIGDISVPSTWGGLYNQTVNWTEYYSTDLSSCSNINYARAYFTQPTFNNGAVVPLYNSQSISSSGGCTNSKITPDGNDVFQEEGIENDLTGNYYNGTNFTNLALTRLDPTINFNWGSGSPANGISKNGFSVKWTGEIQAPETNSYTFCSQYTGGVQLLVANTQLINDLNITNKNLVQKCAIINLTANQFYPVVMEYAVSKVNNHSVNLTYSTSDITTQIVPSTQLRSQ